jgi:hypothetical protein
MQDRKDVTVPMDAELNAAIEEELGYGDSKAGWIRDAIKMRLRAERADPSPEGDPPDTEWAGDAVQAASERVGDDHHDATVGFDMDGKNNELVENLRSMSADE